MTINVISLDLSAHAWSVPMSFCPAPTAAPWHKSIGQAEDGFGHAQHHQHGVDTWIHPPMALFFLRIWAEKKSQEGFWCGLWEPQGRFETKQVIYHSKSPGYGSIFCWGNAKHTKSIREVGGSRHPISGKQSPDLQRVPVPSRPNGPKPLGSVK